MFLDPFSLAAYLSTQPTDLKQGQFSHEYFVHYTVNLFLTDIHYYKCLLPTIFKS